MNRTKSRLGTLAAVGLCALALSGCYYAPAPYAYEPSGGYYAAPAYYGGYYGPPVYGSVVVGGGWGHDHDRDHDHWR